MTHWFTETLRQPNLKVVFLLKELHILKADNTTFLNKLKVKRHSKALFTL